MKRAALVAVILLLSLTASAGDEVDYDAPYLTVVDGKLVTRYPAKPHAENAEQGAMSAAVSLPAALGVLAVAALLAAMFLPALFRRGRGAGTGRPPAGR